MFVVIMLFRKFHMCSVSVKLNLFNSYCSSLYTSHLWWNYKKISVTKLQITYHSILKRNIGLSKYESISATCVFTNKQCCQSTIRNLVFKFVCRLNKSDNALIKSLLASSVVYSTRIHSHLRRLLYVYDHRSHCLSSRSCTLVDNVDVLRSYYLRA